MHCNNIEEIYLEYNTKTSQHTKHVDIRYKYVNEYLEDVAINIVFVRSEDNDTDVFTKNINKTTYMKQKSLFMTDKNSVPKIIWWGVEKK